MKTRGTAVLLCGLVIAPFAVPLSATNASAAPPAAAPKIKPLADTLTGDAKKDYEAGKLLLADGDFAGAAIKFQAAHDKSHDARLLWNIASCEKNMRHYAKATALLERSIIEGTTVLTEAERAQAAELVKALSPFTSKVTIDVSEPDATIEVDDRTVGKSPLTEPLLLDIGPHKVQVTKEGFHAFSTSVPITGSAAEKVVARLEKLNVAGKLSVTAPFGSSVFVDGVLLGTGRATEAIETKLAPGQHGLKVTAPGMRTYDVKVDIRDNETTAILVQLERENEATAPLVRPPLALAVGCIDASPRGAGDLSVYIDNALITADSEKKAYDNELRRDVVTNVYYSVTPGRHQILVRAPACAPVSAQVDVLPAGAGLRGALPSDDGFMLRGPASNPLWPRVSLGLWFPTSMGPYTNVTQATQQASALNGTQYSIGGVGGQLSLATIGRWSYVGADVAYATGSASLDRLPNVSSPAILAALQTASMSWFRAGVRVGFRVPFNVGSFAMGVGTGYDGVKLTSLPQGLYSTNPNAGYGSLWTMLEAQPICDFTVFTSVEIAARIDDALSNSNVVSSNAATMGITVGAAFQPSPRCHAERSTKYGLFPAEASQPPVPPPVAPAPAGVAPPSGSAPPPPPPATSPMSTPPPPPPGPAAPSGAIIHSPPPPPPPSQGAAPR